jgi:hypothetical protein
LPFRGAVLGMPSAGGTLCPGFVFSGSERACELGVILEWML